MVQAKLRWELDSLTGPLMGFSLDFIFILRRKTPGNDSGCHMLSRCEDFD